MPDFRRWSDPQIQSWLNGWPNGYGGQCFGYVSLLLFRSGDSGNRVPTRYGQLDPFAKPVGQARTGDIIYYYVLDRRGNIVESHVAVALQVNRQYGIWFGDSNWGWDERIQTHFVSWGALSQKG